MESLFDQFPTAYIDAQTLLTLFKNYTNPRDRIARMVKKGLLIRLRNGFYLIKEKLKNDSSLPLEQIANLLYGPSYVSLEWALSYYELIPERAVNVTNITTGKTKKIQTPIGLFTYYHLSVSRYDCGVTRQKAQNWPGGFFIASKEKALIDFIFIKWKKFSSISEFIDSTRIDIESIKNLNNQKLQDIAILYKSKTIDKFMESI